MIFCTRLILILTIEFHTALCYPMLCSKLSFQCKELLGFFLYKAYQVGMDPMSFSSFLSINIITSSDLKNIWEVNDSLLIFFFIYFDLCIFMLSVEFFLISIIKSLCYIPILSNWCLHSIYTFTCKNKRIYMMLIITFFILEKLGEFNWITISLVNKFIDSFRKQYDTR